MTFVLYEFFIFMYSSNQYSLRHQLMLRRLSRQISMSVSMRVICILFSVVCSEQG